MREWVECANEALIVVLLIQFNVIIQCCYKELTHYQHPFNFEVDLNSDKQYFMQHLSIRTFQLIFHSIQVQLELGASQVFGNTYDTKKNLQR